MRNTKRILSLALCLLLVCALLSVAALADTTGALVEDSVGLLEQQELEYRDLQARQLQELGIDAPVIILPECDDPDAYAQSYIDADGWGSLTNGTGVMLLLVTPDGDSGSFYLYAFGNEGSRFDLEDLSEKTSEYFQLGNFNTAIFEYLEYLKDFWVDATTVRPDLPDWYPEDVNSFEEFNDPDAPRLVDNAGIINAYRYQEVLEKINAIRDKYGVDLVVYTDNTSYGFSRQLWAEDFFVFNGYGFGEALDGSVLFICMEPGNRGWYSAFSGKAENMIDSDTLNYVDDQMEPYMVNGEYTDGILAYLDALDYVYSHGHAPKMVGGPLAAGAALGALSGGITTGVLKSGMNKVKKATTAERYVRDGSFHLRSSRDVYLYSSYTRTRRSEERGSGGGGGGSSGFSHSSSSSGHSFSGGGRSF